MNNAEAFAATTRIVCCRGGSIKDVFKDGVLRIYSGSQPASRRHGCQLAPCCWRSVRALALLWPVLSTTAWSLVTAASGAIAKATAETWQDTGLAAGTAGYFRLVANATDAGAASTTLPRIDGSVGTSGADLNMSSTTIAVGATYTIDSFTLTLPEYYGA